MNATHTAQTDTKNKFKLESSIIYAEWKSPAAVGGYTAELEVVTAMVGEGATIEIKGKSSKGKAPDSIKGTIHGNYFAGSLPIPEKVDPSAEIWFEAKLSKHGLKMESLPIPARPPIYATSLKWDKQEVHRGDIVKLQGKFEGCLPNSEAQVIVYENNPDGHHDKVLTIPTQLKNLDLEVQWEFDYVDDTTHIPTEPEKQKYQKHYVHVEFFFVVVIDGVKIGSGKESGLLRFKDFLDFDLLDHFDNLLRNYDLEIHFSDGSKVQSHSDAQGHVHVPVLVPGPVQIHFDAKPTESLEVKFAKNDCTGKEIVSLYSTDPLNSYSRKMKLDEDGTIQDDCIVIDFLGMDETLSYSMEIFDENMMKISTIFENAPFGQWKPLSGDENGE
jgi:hypothetical protein